MNPAKNPNEPTLGQGCVTRLKAIATRIAVALVVAVGIICAVPAPSSESGTGTAMPHTAPHAICRSAANSNRSFLATAT